MKKHLSIVLILILLLSLSACVRTGAVLDEAKVYDIKSDIHSLDISINAADFVIESGDSLSVESNLKFLSVSEKDGVLTVVDEAGGNCDYSGATFTLCIPDGTIFEQVKIKTGAAKMTVSSLSAKKLELNLGAGDVRFESLNVSSDIEILGGAGEISIHGGTLNNLKLEMGVGKLNLTSTLSGDCEMEMGVGEANITLLGGRDSYKVDISKGIGSITVDGKEVTDFGSSGDGQSLIDIEGGVGEINIVFEK